MKSPFKFLDAYTLEDKDVFFGRDKEVEELYGAVSKNRLVLVYGQSGTGKTSLVQCGLASRFDATDWYPLFIRRQDDINRALQQALESAMEQWAERPEQLGRLRKLRRTAELAHSLPFEIDLSVVQNHYFRALENELPRFSEQADRGDPVAIEWRDEFRALGLALRMRA